MSIPFYSRRFDQLNIIQWCVYWNSKEILMGFVIQFYTKYIQLSQTGSLLFWRCSAHFFWAHLSRSLFSCDLSLKSQPPSFSVASWTPSHPPLHHLITRNSTPLWLDWFLKSLNRVDPDLAWHTDYIHCRTWSIYKAEVKLSLCVIN
jgi:hypothetical protein